MAKGTCVIPESGNGDPLGGNPSQAKAVDHEDGSRTCKDCGERKPIDSYPADKNAGRGRKTTCKPCWSARASVWYAANQERQLARHQVRREANRDRIRQQDNERYRRNKPKRLALVVDAGNRRRATLRHGGPWDRGITPRALRTRDGDRCCYCDIVMTFEPATGHVFVPGKATVEHVLPISAGGTHTWDNVALACWQCNVRKNRKTVEEWRAVDAAKL